MSDTLVQAFLAIIGITAIILVARKNKWGFVFGLLSEPFWFITSFTHKQWGIFLLTIIYTISWSYGIYEWFSKPKSEK